MNTLVVVFICIVLSHILIFVNLTTAKKGIRDSVSCRYLGQSDPKGKKCREDIVKFKKLPLECSAFIYDGIEHNLNIGIVPKYENSLDIIRSLIDLKGDNDDFHDVYVVYNDSSARDFGMRKLDAEAEEVKKFIGEYPVKGLILDHIPNSLSINEGGDDFYKNFAAYVTSRKSINPSLEIGLQLSGDMFTRVFLNSMSWHDFGKLNDIFDFYVIEFATFNECVDQLLNSGITPLDSSDESIMTLNKFLSAYENSTIDKEKVYFELLISPLPKFDQFGKLYGCEMSYNEYCENREEYKTTWCVDTQDVLYEKGKFAKQHSKGVIGRHIDLVDRDNKCNCDNKYITFYMLLRGYNGEEKLTCDAFKP